MEKQGDDPIEQNLKESESSFHVLILSPGLENLVMDSHLLKRKDLSLLHFTFVSSDFCA